MQRPGPRTRLLNRDTRNNKLSSNLSTSSYVSSWNTVTDWSAFDPATLTPTFWLDASDTSTITDSGGLVSQWRDKSGNNYHANQSTPANQPTTGVDSRNGRNVVTFNGTSTFLDSTVATNVEPLSIVVVARATNNISRNVISGSFTAAPTFGADSNGRLTFSSPGLATIGTANTGPNTVDYHVFSVTYATSGLFQFFLNNQICGGGINDQYFLTVATRIGSDRLTTFWSGQIAEIYKFHRVLSIAEFDSLHRHLQWKWALQF